MEIKSHKFAILDISQRLESSKFKDFCSRLGLHVDSINNIEEEHTLSEEQYYHALKTWIANKKKATFRELSDYLISCGEDKLKNLIIMRLSSTS